MLKFLRNLKYLKNFYTEKYPAQKMGEEKY